MRTHRHLGAVGALTLVVSLAACSSGGDPAPTPSGSGGVTGGLGPVDALQREVIGEVPDDAWARVEHERFEAAVAQCMKAAGFEYTPEEYVAEEESEPTDTLAWARENGYGITTVAEEEGEEEIAEPTPNERYISELDDEQLAAWWEALEGAASQDGEDDGGEIDLEGLDEDGDGEIDLGEVEVGEDGEIDLGELAGEDEGEEIELGEDGEIDLGDVLGEEEMGGCQGEAAEALAANPMPYDLPEHQEVLTALDELYAALPTAEAVVNAEEAWVACMADKGYPDLESLDDATYIVFDAYDAAWEQVPEGEEDISPALIEPVRELELAVATADYECRESAGVEEANRRAQHEAEETFVAEHREALVAYFQDMAEVLEG